MRFWYIVHNVVAHPLLCIDVAADLAALAERTLRQGAALAERFHDWTAERID